jgi:fibronectin type 3 domain-containing protein
MRNKIVSAVSVFLATGLAGAWISVCVAETLTTTTKSTALDASTGKQFVQPLVNRIKWRTAREFRNFGYDVYRSENKKDPFSKITAQIILGHGTTDTIHSYQFEDKDIEPCIIYYYYIESISEDGERRRYSSVRRAPLKDAAGSRVYDASACNRKTNNGVKEKPNENN